MTIEVTQEDRDAAATLLQWCASNGKLAAAMSVFIDDVAPHFAAYRARIEAKERERQMKMARDICGKFSITACFALHDFMDQLADQLEKGA
jgi:hypothetical protein